MSNAKGKTYKATYRGMRAVCPVCRRNVTLTISSGRLYSHKVRGGTRICAGSGAVMREQSEVLKQINAPKKPVRVTQTVSTVSKQDELPLKPTTPAPVLKPAQDAPKPLPVARSGSEPVSGTRRVVFREGRDGSLITHIDDCICFVHRGYTGTMPKPDETWDVVVSGVTSSKTTNNLIYFVKPIAQVVDEPKCPAESLYDSLNAPFIVVVPDTLTRAFTGASALVDAAAFAQDWTRRNGRISLIYKAYSYIQPQVTNATYVKIQEEEHDGSPEPKSSG